MDTLAFIALTTFATIVLVHYFAGGLPGASAYLRWAFSGTVAGDAGRTSSSIDVPLQPAQILDPGHNQPGRQPGETIGDNTGGNVLQPDLGYTGGTAVAPGGLQLPWGASTNWGAGGLTTPRDGGLVRP